jgi:hypothetical protein
MRKKIALAAVSAVCALAFLINHLAAGTTPSLNEGSELSAARPVKEIEGYKNWTKVNPVPQLMPGRVALACFLWITSAGVIIDGETNPHRDKYLTVYVNDLGRKAMLTEKSPVFPVGSVIVKEKLPAQDSPEPELLTVMIKQRKGYNPPSGDWEYMAVNGTGTEVQGRGHLKHCQSCHLDHKKTDYIFRTYLPPEVKAKLK